MQDVCKSVCAQRWHGRWLHCSENKAPGAESDPLQLGWIDGAQSKSLAVHPAGSAVLSLWTPSLIYGHLCQHRMQRNTNNDTWLKHSQTLVLISQEANLLSASNCVIKDECLVCLKLHPCIWFDKKGVKLEILSFFVCHCCFSFSGESKWRTAKHKMAEGYK